MARLSREGPLSITTLAGDVEMSRQAVTKHLRVLAGAGLLRASKQGREQHWEVNERSVEEARRCLERIGRQWDRALGRLKRFVEED